MKHLASLTGRFALVAALVVTLLNCSRPIEPQAPTSPSGARIRVNQTITEVVVGNANFSLLRAAVVRLGLADALASGDLTVFAPTDNAFRMAGFADVNAINSADINTLRNVVLYHVIGTGRFFEDRFSSGMAITPYNTLQGQPLYVTRRDGLSVNGIPVTQPDLEANNGVIHIIDRVLMPPMGNIVEIAAGNPNLTYLVAAVLRANQGDLGGFNLLSALAGNEYTVFAPTNAAFQAAGFPTIASIQNADPNVVSNVLRTHIVQFRRFTTQFHDNNLRSIQGAPLSTTRTPTRALVQGPGNMNPSVITMADIPAINGVVHVIDQVLLPGSTDVTRSITDIVVANNNFSLLRAAVVRLGLANTLMSGNFTVFAPTDDAFRAAGFADVNAINSVDMNTLRNVVLYHVLGDRFGTNNFSERTGPFRTLQGNDVQVTRRLGVSVNGSNVVQANIRATNGVIHAIDRVLMPPMGNIVEIAAGNPNLSYLVAAVTRAGLGQTLVTAPNLTVFAPTNAAFQAAGFPTIASIQAADPAVLTRILTTHALGSRVFSPVLRGGEVRPLSGVQLIVSVAPGQSPTIRGPRNTSAANIVTADIVTLNGVVHVIDQVLLP